MDRGHDRLLPRTPLLEDESYLDYMEAVRNFAITEMFPQLGEQAEQALADAGIPDGGMQEPFETVESVINPLPLYGTWRRVMRSQQQMAWDKIVGSLHADGEEQTQVQRLDEAERERPGRLHYDPAFEVPAYATMPIHLQPGGYVADPLAGIAFHHGTKVFYQGLNDQDELHQDIVARMATPADGEVRRSLDVACSIGQCTTALKQRFPDAEVHGLDVGLPLLRYAHRRAVDLDVDVHFHQGLAEDLPFETGHFDMLLSYILFHEVPKRLFQPIIDEYFRVLRPGGMLTIEDAPNQTEFPAGNRLWLRFDAVYNCEPYSPDFVASDLPAMLEAAGFVDIDVSPTPTFLSRTVARKPAG